MKKIFCVGKVGIRSFQEGRVLVKKIRRLIYLFQGCNHSYSLTCIMSLSPTGSHVVDNSQQTRNTLASHYVCQGQIRALVVHFHDAFADHKYIQGAHSSVILRTRRDKKQVICVFMARGENARFNEMITRRNYCFVADDIRSFLLPGE